MNEAFACQVPYCRDRLGIPDDRLNVDGGAKFVVVTLCVGGGQGAAGLFEVA